MFQNTITPIFRIAVGLVAISSSVLFVAAFIGLIPDEVSFASQERNECAAAIAFNFAVLAKHTEPDEMREIMQKQKARYSFLKSFGVRKNDGTQLIDIDDHFETWPQSKQSSEIALKLPIQGEDGQWGQIEFQFHPIAASSISPISNRTEIKLTVFTASVSAIVFFAYLSFVLRELNPGNAMPSRVREAFDTLAEGLLVLDRSGHVVLANQAFEQSMGISNEHVVGRSADSLDFESLEDEPGPCMLWHDTLKSGKMVQGHLLRSGNNTYSVGASPICDENREVHGAIASFEDVTPLEKKKKELQYLLQKLNDSTNQIKNKNRELEILATQDGLTGSMNRRTFFQKFDKEFKKAVDQGRPLSAFMVDIDHFKSINDNHGHAMGDQVLQKVAKTLEATARSSDIVCRYGGEEFSVLLPDTRIDEAAEVAEQMRSALEKCEFPNLSITTSVGVSSVCQSATSPQDLLEQADKCLYVAKRNGRNQVIRWDQVPQDLEIDESSIARTVEEDAAKIPFHAVTALISALAFRDQETASHCRRVADLCVALGEQVLPMKECYLLEIAALLHDIGKIGVPDSILLKPSELTREEWSVMKKHEMIGIELVNTSFGSEELNEIVANYRNPFDQQRKFQMSVSSRILAIVDAYDSMTMNKCYRSGHDPEFAISELVRCAGQQFDPELVARFVKLMKSRSHQRMNERGARVSKAAALGIGLQIERLSMALDNRNLSQIGAIATHLQATAEKYGVADISQKAKDICTSKSQNGDDLIGLLNSTSELLALCRSSQRSLVDSSLHE